MAESPTKDKETAGSPEKSPITGVSLSAPVSGEGSGSSWYSWLQSAKEKTFSTYELVKNDLTEFTSAVKEETSHLVSATTTSIREHAPQIDTVVEVGGNFAKGLVDVVNTVLQVEDTTKGEDELAIPIAPYGFDRSEARMFFIQTDPNTYLSEPDGAPELFDDWLDNCRLETKTAEMEELLATKEEMKKLHSRLVPSKVANETFWHRYFYKVHQFRLDEARRKALLAKEGEDTSAPWDEDLTSDTGEFEKVSPVTQEPIAAAVTPELSSVDSLKAELDSTAANNSSSPSINEFDPVIINKSDVETASAAPSSTLSDGWASGTSTPPSTDPTESAEPTTKTAPVAKRSAGSQGEGEEWVEWDG